MIKSVTDGVRRHSIEHLAPFSFTYSRPPKGDKPAWKTVILASFSWHCYTRTPEQGERVYLLQDGNEKRCFCPIRYELSKRLPDLIRGLDQSKIYQTGKGNFVTVQVIDPDGHKIEYGVFFTVSKGKKRTEGTEGRTLKLHVVSAYPFHESEKRFQVSRQRIGFNVIVFNTMNSKPIKLFR